MKSPAAGARRGGPAWTVLAAAVLAAGTTLPASQAPGLPASPTPTLSASQPSRLASDLDAIFGDPVLSRALMAVRVEALEDGRRLYALNDEKLVMPASNMKLVTLAVAAERLGWDFTYETRLEAAGSVNAGTLHGDLIVTGGGDPSIGPLEPGRPAPLFDEWARALAAAGIRRVDGRLIGDDNAFDDERLGDGWTLDDLASAYAAPTGALNYNENVAALRIHPGRAAGDFVAIGIAPPGHQLIVANEVRTGPADAAVDIGLTRRPGRPRLTVRGTVPAGGEAFVRSAAIDNPTTYFVEALRLALAAHGIQVAAGAVDIDDAVRVPSAAERRIIARHRSAPFSSLAAYFAKTSQNFYAETVLKTLGRVVAGDGSAAAGRTVVRGTLGVWGVPDDAIVMRDGSGLSRYNYVTASALVTILTRMWQDGRLRGPFAAALPVAGHDGTLESRMKRTALDARVEAKTGTLSNVRALSGYLETQSGRRLVFSMIANHFTAPAREIDAVVERALARLAEE